MFFFLLSQGNIFKTSEVEAAEYLMICVSKAPDSFIIPSTQCKTSPQANFLSSFLYNPSFIYHPLPFPSTLTSHFSSPCFSFSFLSSPLLPSSQMLLRSLKQRRPPRQTQQPKPPSPRMTNAKSHLMKAELRVWRITQKQKSKKVALCLPNVKAVRFYLFVIFCVARIFSCWGSFQREVFWLKLILWGSDDGVDDYEVPIVTLTRRMAMVPRWKIWFVTSSLFNVSEKQQLPTG